MKRTKKEEEDFKSFTHSTPRIFIPIMNIFTTLKKEKNDEKLYKIRLNTTVLLFMPLLCFFYIYVTKWIPTKWPKLLVKVYIFKWETNEIKKNKREKSMILYPSFLPNSNNTVIDFNNKVKQEKSTNTFIVMTGF